MDISVVTQLDTHVESVSFVLANDLVLDVLKLLTADPHQAPHSERDTRGQGGNHCQTSGPLGSAGCARRQAGQSFPPLEVRPQRLHGGTVAVWPPFPLPSISRFGPDVIALRTPRL